MNRDRRASSHDPTDEAAAAQSTQSAGGLSGGREVSGVAPDRLDDTVNRTAEDITPRRYEQPIEDDEDPVMPGDDSTLNTKI